MKDKTDILSNIFVKKLIGSDILTMLEAELNKSHTLTDIAEYLVKAKDVLNFLCRYPKPILSKLVSKKIITEQEIESNKLLFDYFDILLETSAAYYSKAYFRKSSALNDYFEVVISSYHFDYSPLLQDIRHSFTTKQSDSKNVIFVSIKQIDEFIEKYKGVQEIYWFDLCRKTNIPWTNELICKYRDVWDWKYLHRNPAVNWNFELIENNLDKLNWSFVSSYPFLNWNTELLIRYRDSLVFSLDNTDWKKPGTNKQGDRYSIDEDKLSKHYYSNLIGSISLSDYMDWSKELIDCVRDYWDWKELCSNQSINWDADMINYFEEKIDFETLSANPSVKWTESLIKKYESNLSWKNLSGNPNLPWSYNFLIKHESKWQWKPEYDWYSDDKVNYYPSISTNPGIIWNEAMLYKWRNKIDFWRIARVGKLTDVAIRQFHQEFNRRELVGWEHHKYSDWRETAEIHRTGWENFALNKNFFISRENVDFYYQTKIALTYPVGNFAREGNYGTRDFRLIEILKDQNIQGITLTDIIENETGWTQCLLNSQFINESIWHRLIEPMFSKQFGCDYLKTIRISIEQIKEDESDIETEHN